MGIIFCLPRAAAVEVRTYIFEIRQMKCDIAFLTVVDRVSSFSDMAGVYDQSEKEPEFDWLQLHNEIHNQELEETTQQKFIRKVKDNPFVPIGCLATFSALSYGLWSFRRGERQMSQYMMRLRIAAQGFTIVALIVGIGIGAARSSK